MGQITKFLKHKKLYTVTSIIIVIGFIFLSTALAMNVLSNGSFNTDLSSWTLNSQDGYAAPQTSWKSSGYSGTIISGGRSYSGQGGAVQFYRGKGDGLEAKGYLGQSFTVSQRPSVVTLSFAWKKTWAVKQPDQHDLRVFLISPGGTINELWSHTTVASTSDNNWYKVEDLDISQYVTTTGTYEIRLLTQLKTGSATTAEVDAWYDEVFIVDSPPATPTGLKVQDPGNGSELNISWNTNKETDLAGYNLYRSLDGVSYYKLNSSLILDTIWQDTGLTKGQIYYYKVSAVDTGVSESSLTGAVSGTPTVVQMGPGILMNPSFANNLTGWQSSTPIAGRKGVLTPTSPPDFFYDSNGYTGSLVTGSTSYNGNGGAGRLEVSGSDNLGRGHLFQRIYFKPVGGARLSFVWKKNYTGTAPMEHTARVILLKPNGVPVSLWENTETSNSNTWQKVENLDLSSHMIGIGAYQLEFWGHIKNGTNSSAVGQIFYDEIIFSVEKAPSIPLNLQAIPLTTGGEIRLRWDNNVEGNITGYRIWRSTDNVTYTLLTSQPITNTEFLDSGLTNGQRYYYKISGVDQGGRESPQTRPVKVFPRVVPDSRYDAHTGYLEFTDSCRLCHYVHTGQAPRLLNKKNEEALCFTCHDGTASIFNIQPEFTGTKVSFHPVKNTDLSPTGKLSCSSCHDPHDATGIRRSAILAKGSIQGSIGVSVNYDSSAFSQPNMTLKNSLTTEYEQCLRCHSNFVSEVQSSIQATAKEFNPNNLSYHSSVGKSKATGFGTYLDGWLADMPMFCVDCHGSNSTTSPEGPHSSGQKDILKLPYSGNPTAPVTTLCFQCHGSLSHGNGGGSDTGTLFLSRGEDLSKGFASFDRNLHNSPGYHKDYGCAVCHALVPHGFNRRAMLVTTSDPAPYSQYAMNTMIDYPNDGNWQYNSCYTVPGCH